MNPPGPSATLIRALGHALRPMVRLMLGGGVTYPVVAELLKSLFVDVAEREFGLDGQRPSDSRVSLLTGVHRKDVRRLRAIDRSAGGAVPDAVPFGARVIASWLGHPRFADAHGRPRPLPRLRGDGVEASFEELVASHSTDTRARVVLDEWLRLGIVRLDEHDRVALVAEAFVPAAGLDEKLQYFAHHLHDHAACATANLLGERAPELERSVAYAGMSEASIAQLERRAHRLATAMLEDLNRFAIALDANESTPAQPAQRFTCGVYFHSEPESHG